MKKRISILLALLLLLSAAAPFASAQDSPGVTKVLEAKNAKFLGNLNLVVFSEQAFGMSGIMDGEGNTVVPTEYYDLSLDNSFGYINAYKVDDLNGRGMINAQGEVLIPFEYGDLVTLGKDWVMAVKLKESTKENYDYQSLFGSYGSGYYLVESRTFYNMKTGKAVGSLPREAFDKANGYPGFLVIKDMQGVNTVYDEDFVPLGTAEQTYYGYTFHKDGGEFEVKRAGDGALIFTSPYEVTGYDNNDGNFRVEKDYLAGRVDGTGQVLIAPEYEQLQNLANGYAKAKLSREGKFGLVSSDNRQVVPFEYDEIAAAYERGINVGFNTHHMIRGYATVIKDGKVGFVNDQGVETVPPAYAEGAVKKNGNTLMYTDVSGKTVIVAADGVVSELPYAKVEKVMGSLDGRIYLVKNDEGKVAFLDWHGQELLPFSDYADYGAEVSVDGSFLLVQNRETRMMEGYRIPQ